jgi:hypothetical protein
MGRGNTFLAQEIRLTVLGELGWSGSAQLVCMSEGMATVRCVQPLKSGAAIRLDSSDALMLGECCGCRGGEHGYEARIVVHQIIPSITDLVNLVSAIFEGNSQGRVQAQSLNKVTETAA